MTDEETKSNTAKTRMPGWEPILYLLISIGFGRLAAWIIAQHEVDTSGDFTGFGSLVLTVYPIALGVISFGIFITGPSFLRRNGRIVSVIVNVILLIAFWAFVSTWTS